MADETTQFILGDAAADAAGSPRKRRFFRRKTTAPPLINCENCGTQLAGEYCAQCGQHAIDYRRSLLLLVIDAADSFLNWDTKFLKSVGIMLFKPWRLTNDFNAGRRVRYVHPLRLYLLASIAFFLIIKTIHFDPSGKFQLSPKDRAEISAAISKLAGSESLTPEQRTRIEVMRSRFEGAEEIPDLKEREKFDRAMMKLQGLAEKQALKAKDLERLEAALQRMEGIGVPPVPEIAGLPGANPSAAGDPAVSPAPAVAPAAPADPAAPSATATPARRQPRIQFTTGSPPPIPKAVDEADKLNITVGKEGEPKNAFETWLESRIKSKVGEDGTNVQLFIDTLRDNLPTMMLCCIPLFALVLKVLYFFQRRYYVEHLVYALHIHTFAYVAAVVISLIGMAAERWLPAVQLFFVLTLSFAAVVLVFLSIRRVYRQGWFMTTVKFILGGTAYFFVLVFAVMLTALVTLALP